tara:strand:+ start:501 stop:743 length:243 start_codon:yes stop_codon:yes gene_type:complete
MANSEELLKKFGKLIENGINSYKDLNSEIINICKSKRDEFLFKMKIVGKEDLDILRKRIEKLEIEFAKTNKKKIKKAKKR